VVEELGWEVEDVVVEEVLVMLLARLVVLVLGGMEVLVDDDDKVVSELVEVVDGVVGGTGVGDVGVVLGGKEVEGDSEVTDEVVEGTLQSDVLAQKSHLTRQNVRWGHRWY